MTFNWPESLHPLRDVLKKHGVPPDRHATARQAAFFAQQVIGSRIKFPPQGSDMMPVLLKIQEALPKGIAIMATPSGYVHDTHTSRKSQKPAGQPVKIKSKPEYLTAFTPAGVTTGYHVFADGAAVPNPGEGGWGFVAYRDGVEIYSDCGGEAESTNNRMEITAVLNAARWAAQYPAIVVTIWTDSQYTCNGVNDWRHGWKKNGWQRGSDKADPKNRILLNAELWKQLDAVLIDPRAEHIKVQWVKGHNGTVGNERADELAEIGRQQLERNSLQLTDDLDAQYRAIMSEDA
jgi:ribonuclease HI